MSNIPILRPPTRPLRWKRSRHGRVSGSYNLSTLLARRWWSITTEASAPPTDRGKSGFKFVGSSMIETRSRSTVASSSRLEYLLGPQGLTTKVWVVTPDNTSVPQSATCGTAIPPVSGSMTLYRTWKPKADSPTEAGRVFRQQRPRSQSGSHRRRSSNISV